MGHPTHPTQPHLSQIWILWVKGVVNSPIDNHRHLESWREARWQVLEERGQAAPAQLSALRRLLRAPSAEAAEAYAEPSALSSARPGFFSSRFCGVALRWQKGGEKNTSMGHPRATSHFTFFGGFGWLVTERWWVPLERVASDCFHFFWGGGGCTCPPLAKKWRFFSSSFLFPRFCGVALRWQKGGEKHIHGPSSGHQPFYFFGGFGWLVTETWWVPLERVASDCFHFFGGVAHAPPPGKKNDLFFSFFFSPVFVGSPCVGRKEGKKHIHVYFFGGFGSLVSETWWVPLERVASDCFHFFWGGGCTCPPWQKQCVFFFPPLFFSRFCGVALRWQKGGEKTHPWAILGPPAILLFLGGLVGWLAKRGGCRWNVSRVIVSIFFFGGGGGAHAPPPLAKKWFFFVFFSSSFFLPFLWGRLALAERRGKNTSMGHPRATSHFTFFGGFGWLVTERWWVPLERVASDCFHFFGGVAHAPPGKKKLAASAKPKDG